MDMQGISCFKKKERGGIKYNFLWETVSPEEEVEVSFKWVHYFFLTLQEFCFKGMVFHLQNQSSFYLLPLLIN